MKKQLKDLLSSVAVTGITDDSRKVKKGFLFVAIKGLKSDGHDFIPQAITNGAKVIVAEKEEEKDWTSQIKYVRVDNSREALSHLAAEWYGNPSEKLKLIGVTGTDGKTTTANIIYWILKTAGKKAGLISTIGAKIGNKEVETGLHVTNPEPLELQKLLREMVDAGCEYAVLEVTSHGLDQERVAGMEFEISVLTNITSEHLDYHKTFENYLLTKARLFEKSKVAVLNKEDKSYKKFRKILSGREILEYPEELGKSLNGAIEERFPQSYNRINAAAAVAVCVNLGIPDEVMEEAIENFPDLSGRLEEIPNNRGIKIIVDFAHTPNALENVLTNLRQQVPKKSRLIAVFGCAGERDKSKRPQMGRIASKYSNIVILTAEDPRTEKVEDIIYQIKAGIPKSFENVLVETNREKAIKMALEIAHPDDTIGLFGKGHEKSMNYDGVYETPWSDQKIVRKYLRKINK
jgi:UDP-N-acetylmuramoyl-L-alanyl-D-glutamate--2,6-diaminopimelate ligase